MREMRGGHREETAKDFFRELLDISHNEFRTACKALNDAQKLRLLEAFEADEDSDIFDSKFEAQEYLDDKENEEDDDWFEEKKPVIEAILAEFE